MACLSFRDALVITLAANFSDVPILLHLHSAGSVSYQHCWQQSYSTTAQGLQTNAEPAVYSAHRVQEPYLILLPFWSSNQVLQGSHMYVVPNCPRPSSLPKRYSERKPLRYPNATLFPPAPVARASPSLGSLPRKQSLATCPIFQALD